MSLLTKSQRADVEAARASSTDATFVAVCEAALGGPMAPNPMGAGKVGAKGAIAYLRSIRVIEVAS